MRNLKFLCLFMLGVLVASCGDPDLAFYSYDELGKGAFARTLSLTGSYSLSNVAGSSRDARVEFYDENNGKNVASYNWTVEFRANGGGNGGANIPATSFVSLPSSSFTTNADGLPEVSFSLRMSEAMTALGLTSADIVAGDQIRFEATITKTDGSTFTQATAGGNVVGQPPFAALFRVNATVAN